jgi:eukaryotic-like serine/threonine-protein kinase
MKMDSAQAKIFAQSLEKVVIGGWTVAGVFGSGKSAVVFRASKEGVRGALKVFHPELVERYGRHVQLERVQRETNLVGAHHPHLVRILDGGACPQTGHLFVVMEPLAERNLQQTLHEIPPENISSIIAQLASAARFLEDRGLAHRDIKPENVAIADNFSMVTLLDLGVLKPIGLSDLTDLDQRAFIGTLRYSSPEFLLRKEPDTVEGWRAVTFYQLGAVLHDLLMRKGLYAEYENPFASLVQAIEDPSTNPDVYGSDTRLVALCRNCLLKNPATRMELVKWEDFAAIAAPPATEPPSEARERIRKRQQFYKAQVQSKVGARGETTWTIRQIMLDASNRLEMRCLAIVNGLDCFPLRETRSNIDDFTRTCVTKIEFEADEDLGLGSCLWIEVELHMVDYNGGSPVFHALSAAALVVGPAEMPKRKRFCSGQLPSLLDSPELEAQFTSALEAAYMMQDNGVTASADKPVLLSLYGAQQ